MNVDRKRQNLQDFEVRYLQENDGAQIGRLFQEVWGDDYLDPIVYDSNALLGANQSGDMVSFVVDHSTAGVVGHIALIRRDADAGIFELSQGVTQPGYKGRGIFKMLLDRVLEEAHVTGKCRVLFAEPVTNHIFTQSPLYQVGFRDTGLFYAMVPSEMMAKEFDRPRAVSTLMQFHFADPGDSRVIFLPSHYAPLAQKIYKQFGMIREIKNSEMNNHGIILNNNVTCTVIQDKPRFGVTQVHVEQFGYDFAYHITCIEKENFNQGRRVIYVHIPINHPFSEVAINMLREKDYVFGAILPLWNNIDTLVMQKSTEDISDNEIYIKSDLGNEINNFINNELLKIRNKYFLNNQIINIASRYERHNFYQNTRFNNFL